MKEKTFVMAVAAFAVAALALGVLFAEDSDVDAAQDGSTTTPYEVKISNSGAFTFNMSGPISGDGITVTTEWVTWDGTTGAPYKSVSNIIEGTTSTTNTLTFSMQDNYKITATPSVTVGTSDTFNAAFKVTTQIASIETKIVQYVHYKFTVTPGDQAIQLEDLTFSDSEVSKALTVGTMFTDQLKSTTIGAISGPTVVKWSASGLPTGLAMDSKGKISGTPNAAVESSKPNVTVTITTSEGVTYQGKLTITVSASSAVELPVTVTTNKNVIAGSTSGSVDRFLVAQGTPIDFTIDTTYLGENDLKVYAYGTTGGGTQKLALTPSTGENYQTYTIPTTEFVGEFYVSYQLTGTGVAQTGTLFSAYINDVAEGSEITPGFSFVVNNPA